MKTSIITGAAGVVLGAALVGAIAPQDPTTQDPAEIQRIMEANSAKFMEVTEHHQELAKRAGNWNVKIEFQTAPGGPMTSMDGSSTAKVIMGGLFLEETFTGTMPAEFGGQEFVGRGFSGYDNFKEKYIGIWFDNMGSGIYTSEGSEKGDALEFTSEMPDFLTTKTKSTRSVERWTGDNTRVMEMYEAGPDGEEMMTMRLTYTRAGGGAR